MTNKIMIHERIMGVRWELDQRPLKEVLTTIQNWSKKYGDTAYIAIQTWNDGDLEVDLMRKREETEEESSRRIESEQARLQLKESHERKLYEALSKKFGDK